MRNPQDKPMISMPNFIYGTAWKAEATTDLTAKALAAGFTGIDTANQAKHYQEALVGQALATAFANGVQRQQLFIQTKYTSIGGQDHRLPYDPEADLPTQVAQSFASSLAHLQVDYLDSYLLHGPHAYPGLVDEDWQVWGAIEKIFQSGKTKCIGVSNVNAVQLQGLLDEATVKPMVVQNRCYARLGWDRQVREICQAHGIIYQGFSLLTANLPVLEHPKVVEIAAHHQLTIAQTIFSFAMEIGILPLTGTTNVKHMQEDLQSKRGILSVAEIQQIMYI